MQNIAVNKYELLGEKKKSFELAEKEAVDAENNDHAIKLEIEDIKVKSQFEETFLRFPHIAEQVFEILDVQSLSKCQIVSKCWQSFIFETKPFFRQLENYTSIPRLMIRKSLKNYQFQTIQKMAYCASICHEKAVKASIPFTQPPPFEPKGPILFYYILSEGKFSTTQFLLAKLMILNKMNQLSPSISLNKQERNIYQTSLAEIREDAINGTFGKTNTSFKHLVMIEKGKMKIIWSGVTILYIAIAQNHLAIYKLVFEQIKDENILHKWGRAVLQFATQLGYKEVCAFIIDEIQGIDLLVEKQLHGENLLQMAKRLGHKEICTLIENQGKKYK